MENESVCTLGYHSQTQWLVEPHIILLYDKVVMNKSVYDMIISRGQEKRSTLDYLLSQLLLEYERQGIVVVEDLESQVAPDDRQMADQLIEYWEENIPEAFRSLAIELTEARKQRLERKLEYLDEVGEPMFDEISRAAATLDVCKERLERGEVPDRIREGIRHNLQHVLVTQRMMKDLPIFEWYGCSMLRSWLMSVPSFQPFAARSTRDPFLSLRSTEKLALDVYAEVFIPRLRVTDQRQLNAILSQRKELKGARQEIRRMNQAVWQFVNSRYEYPWPDVLEEFTGTLRKRVERVQQQFESVTLERGAAEGQPLIRIVTAMASAATSLASIVVPVAGVAEDALSDRLVEWLTKTTVDGKYPQLAWCYTFEKYKQLYKKSLLRRANVSVSVRTYGERAEPELRELDFCRNLGISRRTLYEWEAQHLLPAPGRSWQGWKVYSSRHVQVGRELLRRPLT